MLDQSKKELKGQYTGRRKNRQGWKAERINRKRFWEEEIEEQKEKERMTSGASHLATQQAMEWEVKKNKQKQRKKKA